MKKGRRTVEKDTAKPRVKFSPDIPELPLNNLSDLEDDDSSLDLTYDDFAYGGSKSSRAARNRPPAVGRDPGNYGPLSAREIAAIISAVNLFPEVNSSGFGSSGIIFSMIRMHPSRQASISTVQP